MPKLACNGFSMFSNHWKNRLEAQRGRQFRGMEELFTATTPIWKQLSEDEKKFWKEKSKQYKRSDEYHERKRLFGRRGGRNQKQAGNENSEDEYDSDFDPGVPMVRSLARQDAADGLEDDVSPAGALDRKRQADKIKLYDFLATASGGRLADVKRCRFLILTMQGFGPLEDDSFAPAEMGIVEWSLGQGILDEFHRVIGPWNFEEKPSRDRAILNSNMTHRIPLEGCPDYEEFTMSRRAVLRELLGRTEPGIAFEEGVRVGLYKNGLVETDPAALAEESVVGRSSSRKKNIWPLLPGDIHGRRWVIVLPGEYQLVMKGVEYLLKQEGIVYEGFPTCPERFVFLDTVLEALADFIRDRVSSSTRHLLSALNAPSRTTRADGTPWDHLPDLYCSFHQDEPAGDFCAIAQARKAARTVFHCLQQAYDLPF